MLENEMEEIMQPGMTFTIEPIILMRNPKNYSMWKDGWTVVASDIPSAVWEHTILITENGHEILTLRDGENIIK